MDSTARDTTHWLSISTLSLWFIMITVGDCDNIAFRYWWPKLERLTTFIDSLDRVWHVFFLSHIHLLLFHHFDPFVYIKFIFLQICEFCKVCRERARDRVNIKPHWQMCIKAKNHPILWWYLVSSVLFSDTSCFNEVHRNQMSMSISTSTHKSR